MSLRLPALVAVALVLSSCSSSDAGPTSDTPSSAPASSSASADLGQSPAAGVGVTGEPGEEPVVELAEEFAPVDELVLVDLVDGTGDPVEPGAELTVHYVGVGQQTRNVFDSSWGGEPATFPLDRVIAGWQEGMLGMQPGGRRLLIIPGSMAYGPDGIAGVIGPDETLVFVVDLIDQVPAA